MPSSSPPRTILVAESDPTTRDLLAEWLAAEGWSVTSEPSSAPIAAAVVEVQQPKCGGDERVREVRALHPDAPILAISSAFISSVQRCGACARLLGVEATLAKPLDRDAVVEALRELVVPPA
jgi:CheY-like chemotaxis protein